MTLTLFRDDAYLQECRARVQDVGERGIVLDRTVFYPQGGGQPGDAGTILRADGGRIAVANTVYGEDRKTILHLLAPDLPPPGDGGVVVGEEVTARIDWSLRLPRMRIHTALHLLSVVLPYPVTGGAIGDGEGRLDFDIPDGGLERAALSERLNALIARDAPVSERWITDEELEADPGLVKTLSVKPPRGSGRVRLIAIEGIDLQPCGGTHVRRTGEIGAVAVTDIQKKGKQNRRVRIALA